MGARVDAEVVATGKTIEEAVSAGLRRLGLSVAGVSVEVLLDGSEPSAVNTPAGSTVRVKLVPIPDINGTACVSRGEVIVTPPIGNGRPARIGPGNGIDVFVNGRQVQEITDILPTDQVRLGVRASLSAEDRFQVEVDDGGMAARLRISPIGAYTIADSAPAEVLVPRLSFSTGSTVTAEEVEAALADRRICYGIDRAAIARTLAEVDGEWHVIATGKPLQPARSTSVRWLVQPQSPHIDENERVDHRERSSPLTVQTETALAVVEPATEGSAGITVFGEELEPGSPPEMRVVPGPGAELHPGGTIVATRSGRPVEVSLGSLIVVRVMPLYQHVGDVDLASGNLRVKSDLLITGGILTGMEVAALGGVTVHGNVLGARVRAGGAIQVGGNCIASTLVAGGRHAFHRAVSSRLVELDDYLRRMILAVGQVVSASPLAEKRIEASGLGPLLRALTEKSLSGFIPLCEQIAALVDEMTTEEDEVASLLQQAMHTRLLKGRLFEVRSLAELAEAKHTLTRVRETLESESDETADLRLPYCEQSTLRSSGNIYVTGLGSYRSDLTAGGKVEIAGTVAGGTIRAAEAVIVKRGGNEANVATFLEVAETGHIAVRLAYPNLWLRVGRETHSVTRPGPVTARLGRDGHLLVL
jgi:uncharacterized protein